MDFDNKKDIFYGRFKIFYYLNVLFQIAHNNEEFAADLYSMTHKNNRYCFIGNSPEISQYKLELKGSDQ